jgi:hypothetical protein
MAEVRVRDRLWQDFVTVAQKQQKAPQALVQRVLEDYIQRVTDEELLARSARAARRTRFRLGQTEEVVRRYRHRA